MALPCAQFAAIPTGVLRLALALNGDSDCHRKVCYDWKLGNAVVNVVRQLQRGGCKDGRACGWSAGFEFASTRQCSIFLVVNKKRIVYRTSAACAVRGKMSLHCQHPLGCLLWPSDGQVLSTPECSPCTPVPVALACNTHASENQFFLSVL